MWARRAAPSPPHPLAVRSTEGQTGILGAWQRVSLLRLYYVPVIRTKVITSSLPVLQRRNGGGASLQCDPSGRRAKMPSFGQRVRQLKDLFPCQHWWVLDWPIYILLRLIQPALVTAIPELLPEAGIGEAGMLRLEFANRRRCSRMVAIQLYDRRSGCTFHLMMCCMSRMRWIFMARSSERDKASISSSNPVVAVSTWPSRRASRMATAVW